MSERRVEVSLTGREIESVLSALANEADWCREQAGGECRPDIGDGLKACAGTMEAVANKLLRAWAAADPVRVKRSAGECMDPGCGCHGQRPVKLGTWTFIGSVAVEGQGLLRVCELCRLDDGRLVVWDVESDPNMCATQPIEALRQSSVVEALEGLGLSLVKAVLVDGEQWLPESPE